jgi:hypothetical protein
MQHICKQRSVGNCIRNCFPNYITFVGENSLWQSLACLHQLLSESLLVGAHLLQEGLWVLLKRKPGGGGTVGGWGGGR